MRCDNLPGYRVADLLSPRGPARLRVHVRCVQWRRSWGDPVRGVLRVWGRLSRYLVRRKVDAVLRERTPDGVEWIGLVAGGNNRWGVPLEAQRLYIGALFQKSRRWCSLNMTRWFVLSAKHGLLLPETRVAHYEVTLPLGESSDARLARFDWGKQVRSAMIERQIIADPCVDRQLVENGGVSSPSFVVLAGQAYVDLLSDVSPLLAALLPARWAGGWPTAEMDQRSRALD